MPLIVGFVKPKVFFCGAQLVNTIATGLLGLAAFLVFKDSEKYATSVGWIPFASIILQSVMRAIGILPVLRPLLMEVYPMEIRTLGIGITQSAFVATGFIAVKMFKTMESIVNLHGMCFFWTAIGLITTIWGFFSVPDNRGKNLNETSSDPAGSKADLVSADPLGNSRFYMETSEYTLGANRRSSLRFAHTSSIYM